MVTWYNPKTSLAIVIAVVVIAAIGFGVYWANHRKTAQPSSTTSAAVIKGILDEANADNVKGQYDEAIALINKNLSNTSATDQQQLYLALGSTYMNKQDYLSALSSYQKADAAKSTFGTSESVGDAAAAAGNKQLAISQYKKCLGLIKDGKAAATDTQESGVLRSEIISLGGTP